MQNPALIEIEPCPAGYFSRLALLRTPWTTICRVEYLTGMVNDVVKSERLKPGAVALRAKTEQDIFSVKATANEEVFGREIRAEYLSRNAWSKFQFRQSSYNIMKIVRSDTSLLRLIPFPMFM